MSGSGLSGMRATARQKTSSTRSGATFSTIGRIDAAGLVAMPGAERRRSAAPAGSRRRSMTWIDSVRAERAAGLSRSARPGASNAQAQACSSGFFQPGDDPSHPFRIGPGHPRQSRRTS